MFNGDCSAVNTNNLRGIFFNDADGTADHVTVLDITQHSGCQVGNAIRANALGGTPRTVTVTNSTVSGFQKNGITGTGLVTLNVSGSTIGPPDAHPAGLIATNSVQYGIGGAGGTFTNNTVIGSGFGGSSSDGSTAILLFNAANVTIDHNTVSGAGTDLGISVNLSRNVTVSFNTIGRDSPDSPDPTGIGVDVDADSATTTLICNTFSGWNTDITGAADQPCPTTTPPTTVAPTTTTTAGGAVAGEGLARTGSNHLGPLVYIGLASIVLGLILLSHRRVPRHRRPPLAQHTATANTRVSTTRSGTGNPAVATRAARTASPCGD